MVSTASIHYKEDKRMHLQPSVLWLDKTITDTVTNVKLLIEQSFVGSGVLTQPLRYENHFQRTPRTASLPAGNITLNCTMGGSASSLTETVFNHKNRVS